MTHPDADYKSQVQHFFATKDREYRRCLAFGMTCRRNPIRAHSIQNRRVLDALALNGTLVAPQLSFTEQAGPRFEFKPEGRNRASTFAGLCAHHDHKLFSAIDTKPLDPRDPEQLFLLAYRAVLRGVHTEFKVAAMLQAGYMGGIEHGFFADSATDAAGQFATERLVLAWLSYRYLVRFWEIHAAASFDSCRHIVLDFPSCRPAFAASSLFDWRSATEQPKGDLDLQCCVLTVIPEDGHVYAIISCLKSHQAAVKSHLASLLGSSGRKQRALLSQLVLRRSENLVLAPAFFQALPADHVDAISRFFVRTAVNPEYTESDDRLYLFWP